MIKLLRSNITRITKSATFWICSSAYLLYSIIIAIIVRHDNNPVTFIDIVYQTPFINNCGFNGSPFTGFYILTFLSIIIGSDFNNNAIRNKILMGHSKSKIYLSDVMAFSICAIAVNLFFLIIALCVAKKNYFEAKDVVWIVINNILTITLYVSLYSLIIMTIKNTAASIVIGFVLTTSALFIMPFMITNINDGYLESLCIMAFFPAGGDAIVGCGIKLAKKYPYLISIYTPCVLLCMTAIMTHIGISIFKKSNIK